MYTNTYFGYIFTYFKDRFNYLVFGNSNHLTITSTKQNRMIHLQKQKVPVRLYMYI